MLVLETNASSEFFCYMLRLHTVVLAIIQHFADWPAFKLPEKFWSEPFSTYFILERLIDLPATTNSGRRKH